MTKIYFLFIILFNVTNPKIKENPIFLVESKNPFVLSTNDDYYYVITVGQNLKIKKESGIIENYTDNYAKLENYIFISDSSNNNYLYYSNKYYKIIYNPFISSEEVIINETSIYHNMTCVGLISNNTNNDIIIYGHYTNDDLIFSKNLGLYSKLYSGNITDYKIICKFIEGENFICGLINKNKLSLDLYCLKHHIDANDI